MAPYAPAVTATVEFYEQVLSAFPDADSLTVLVAAGVTRDEVLASLRADLDRRVEDAWDFGPRSTAWAAIEVPGGVLAVELSGFGDPSLADLGALSKGGAAAVVRSNILGHGRFGCARAGEVSFDDDEFTYIDDPERVPAELRPLFDAAWDDLEDEDEDEGGGEGRADPFPTGLAMAELITGIELTKDQVAALLETDFFLAPSGRYPGSEVSDEEPPAPAKVRLERGVRRIDDGPVWTNKKGRYMLISDWDYMFDQDKLPKGTDDGFSLTVADHTAWVGAMAAPPTQVMVSVLGAQVEPTQMLADLRSAYSAEVSGVVVARRAGLEVWGKYGNRSIKVTDEAGTFAVHVFTRRPGFEEEHVIVVWPATKS
jgi:hypothetical protein